MLTFLKGVNASTSYDIKCWWQSNFSFNTWLLLHGEHSVSPCCHLPIYLSQKRCKHSELRLCFDSDLAYWQLNFPSAFFEAFINVPQHSQVCVFVRSVQIWIGNWDGIFYLKPHLLIQKNIVWNYSCTRCGICSCAYLL